MQSSSCGRIQHHKKDLIRLPAMVCWLIKKRVKNHFSKVQDETGILLLIANKGCVTSTCFGVILSFISDGLVGDVKVVVLLEIDVSSSMICASIAKSDKMSKVQKSSYRPLQMKSNNNNNNIVGLPSQTTNALGAKGKVLRNITKPNSARSSWALVGVLMMSGVLMHMGMRS